MTDPCIRPAPECRAIGPDPVSSGAPLRSDAPLHTGRRHVLRALPAAWLLAGGAAAAGAFATAQAQAADAAWPTKPVTYIVPFSTGGVSDGVARLLAPGLSQQLGVPLLVENRPGVSGIVGTQIAARAAADGQTVIGGTITTHAVNPLYNDRLGYDPVTSFAPVALVGTVSNVLVVRADSPLDSVPKLIQAAKDRPDALTYGSSGPGTTQQLGAQLFESITGARMREVPYKGGSQAMVDLLGGQIDMIFETVAAARSMIDAGKVRVLGVTSAAPLASLPGVPTLAAQGLPGFELQSWQAIFAPAGTPQRAIDRLAAALAAVVADDGTQQALRRLGVEPDSRGPGELARFQQSEITRWRQVIESTRRRDAGAAAPK